MQHRTALFRLLRPNRSRPGRPNVDLFLPCPGPDEDRLESILLGIAASIGYGLVCFLLLRAILPWPIAAFFTLLVLFLFFQVVTVLSAWLQAAAQRLGLRSTPPDGDFVIQVYLLILTGLALGSLATPWAILGWIWLSAVALNLAAAWWLHVRPPWTQED